MLATARVYELDSTGMRDVESEAGMVSSNDKGSMVVDLKTPTPTD